jgi:hypothetical protein
MLHSPLFSAANPEAMSQIGILPFLVLLSAATVSSMVVAALYQYYFAHAATGSQIYRAFSLIGLTITGLFVAVQFSLPLSLGLLGALSLVRFRNPLKEPEEVGALMVIIAIAVASATFKLEFLGILLAITVVALGLQRAAAPRVWRAPAQGSVVITVPAAAWAQATDVRRAVSAHLGALTLDAISADEHRVVVSYTFQGPDPELVGLRQELGRHEQATIDVRRERQEAP